MGAIEKIASLYRLCINTCRRKLRFVTRSLNFRLKARELVVEQV